MLSEQYCKNLEHSICDKQKQIRKLRNEKFVMGLLVVAGWSLFFLTKFQLWLG